MQRFWAAAAIVATVCGVNVSKGVAAEPNPPAGFTALFDGNSFANWRGEPMVDPVKEAAMSPAEHQKTQAKWDADRAKHWKIENGELVSDGHGVYLTTAKNYGDFEVYVDWKLMEPNGDSGIYLRGYPQVQVWNPDNPREVKNGATKGSGALWNDNADNPGKWPLVRADNPIGQWNTFHIKMIGSRVWVWLNGKQTVNGAVLDNYYNRKLPVVARGPIQLQTHTSEVRFRNVYVREIPTAEANDTLRKLHTTAGFESVFNGKDFTGWAGPVKDYQVVDGAILCKPHHGGTIYTEQEYGDFEAMLEFKLPPAGNNGLAIRYPGSGDTAYVGMCELQILDNTAHIYDHLDPRQYCGSVYGVIAAHRGYLRPVGDWNFEYVKVHGHHISVELNGTVITDGDVSKVHEFAGNHKHPGLMRTSGHFGFAGHNDPVMYRAIELKKD